ncbi:Rieske 2Fe-2S domain-containing protein [Myxococcota bacterium]|nr:Rieske 2Fe-2S domain-containing protein [Myxococcota bacterium]
MSRAPEDTLDPRLAVLITAPFSHDVYVARLGSLTRRYETALAAARTTDRRARARLELGLLHDHPSSLLEAARVGVDGLASRLDAARAELVRLAAGAPLPAPVSEPERTLVLAFADTEWLMRELRLLRRVLRLRPPAAIVERYATIGRADPLPDLGVDVVRAIGVIPRGQVLRVAARIAGARHGVSDVRERLVPEALEVAAEPDARVFVCKRSELVPGIGWKVETPTRPIAVFDDGGVLCAVDDVCPHRGGPLHQGDVEGGAVLCPLHAWAFDLRTGKMRGNPRLVVATYPVEVDGDDVFVRATPMNGVVMPRLVRAKLDGEG